MVRLRVLKDAYICMSLFINLPQLLGRASVIDAILNFGMLRTSVINDFMAVGDFSHNACVAPSWIFCLGLVFIMALIVPNGFGASFT